VTHLTRFSFGATSAIVTSLAFIVSLSDNPEPKGAIISTLLVFAVADNVSDSLGIHIFQESDLKVAGTIAASTFSNFLTRLSIISMFVLVVYLLPIGLAVYVSVIIGVAVLTMLSYLIAVERHSSTVSSVATHLVVAILVIAVSYILRIWISYLFG